MNRRYLFLALALAGTTQACGPKKPPKVDTEDTAPTVDPNPAPPPPPKCESLDEKCEASGSKKARVAGMGLEFVPVSGWTYAQGEKATVAQTGTETACLALAGHEAADAKDAKKLEAARQAEFEVLTTELGITLGKGKVAWKNPVDSLDVGDLKLQIWELKEPVTRGTKKGALVIVAGPPSDGKALLAIGFVPNDDDASGGKIMEAFQTLAPGTK
ncbi:MAG: hypothetical protein R3B70_44915 [Polyangiaceae bacterium]